MKITRTDPLYVQNPAATQAGCAIHPVEPRASQADAQISSTAQFVNQARAELATTSDVDMDKVNRIRRPSAKGKLELDMDALGQAILDMHRR
ncbi:flagellar biosynthesis anti-sigma factor FlgM [Aeromonas veronii]